MTAKLRIAGDSSKPLPAHRKPLTQGGLASLVCPAGKRRVRHRDSKAPGLVYAITRAGARDWYWYGRVKGQPRPIEYHLGDGVAVGLDSARTLAKAVSAQAAQGVDPREHRRAAKARAQADTTIGELWKRYREQHLQPHASPTTLRADDSRYKLHLSAWKTKGVLAITRKDVADFHAAMTKHKEKGPNVADKTIKLLRRMLAWAKVNPNPAASGAVDFHGDEQRERFLSQDELSRLLLALESCGNDTIADAIRFALLTGARRGNVCGARWQDIHLDAGLWIIPKDQSKNGRPMTIALAPPAIDLLKRRRTEIDERIARRQRRYGFADPESTPYVFPGRELSKPLTEIKSTWAAICKAAKIDGVRFHDLRHTLASYMAMSGASLLVIGKQLGHANKQSTARYAHLEINTVRPATEAALAKMLGH